MFNVREQVTTRIIAALEAGTPPWRQGWASGQPHFNASSEKPYQGINQILLGMSGFSDPRWLTLKQANAKGLAVKKGEKSSMVVRMVEVTRNEGDRKPAGDVLAMDEKTALVMRAYHVFNATQIEGMPPLPQHNRTIEPVAAVENVISGLKADGTVLLHGGDQAYYAPKTDTIRLPEKGSFKSTEDYYSTVLHEASHATGHKKRLDRFGLFEKLTTVESRAREELKAELASAMLGVELGLPLGDFHIQNHAAYAGSWLEALKKDKTEIFKAAAASQHICDWLKSHAVAPAVDADVKTEPQQAVAANEVALEPAEVPRRRRAGMRM